MLPIIKKIYFDECREVHKGDTLAVIEDAEFRLCLGQTDAGIKLAEAALDIARLNLSYTVITAPCDGTTGRKGIQEGQLIQPGQTIVDLVDRIDGYSATCPDRSHA